MLEHVAVAILTSVGGAVMYSFTAWKHQAWREVSASGIPEPFMLRKMGRTLLISVLMGVAIGLVAWYKGVSFASAEILPVTGTIGMGLTALVDHAWLWLKRRWGHARKD